MTERRFVLHSAAILDHMVAFLSKHLGGDRPLEVIVRPYIEKRSLEQNARLWLLHTAAAKVVGCSPEDMHEDMLCAMFGYTEVRMPSGDLKRVPLKRSSARNRKEFAEFMEYVESFYIRELGVWLDAREAA